jgi:RNA polymerase sigma-70 factor (ECF subfamily)
MTGNSLDQDAQLVRETLAGDDKAFKKLMEKYVRIAGSIAYSIVGDYHIAADVVQEAFVKVHRLLRTLANPRTFRTYLSGAVRTSALDWVRRQKSLRRGTPVSYSHHEEDEHDLLDEHPVDLAPITRIQNSENYLELIDLINALPEHYREVFILKHIENLSYKDIADILGISFSAVEARLFRARRILRDALGRQD